MGSEKTSQDLRDYLRVSLPFRLRCALEIGAGIKAQRAFGLTFGLVTVFGMVFPSNPEAAVIGIVSIAVLAALRLFSRRKQIVDETRRLWLKELINDTTYLINQDADLKNSLFIRALAYGVTGRMDRAVRDLERLQKLLEVEDPLHEEVAALLKKLDDVHSGALSEKELERLILG